MIPPEDNRADETARPFGKESIAGLIHQFTAEFSRAKVDVAVESFLGRFFPEQFDKNDYFVRSGDLCTRLGFVTEGVIRAFHSTDQGEEYTKTVFQEGHFVAPLAALTTGEASPVSLQALTPVKMLVADYRELQSLLHNHHCLEHFTRMVIQWEWVKKEIREIRLVTLSAEERYDIFLEEYAGLEKRIPWYYIASFLGITPVALSRIRGKKREKH